MGKALKLWNGRLHPYEHGYIAAYSRADARRVWHEALGEQRGTMIELTQYWSEGLWGNAMIGITPERGMWAQLSDRSIVRLNNSREYAPTRGPEWEEHLAKEKAEREEWERNRQQEHERHCSRVKKLAAVLVTAGFRVGVKDRVAFFEWEGYEYKVTEAGPVPERDAEN